LTETVQGERTTTQYTNLGRLLNVELMPIFAGGAGNETVGWTLPSRVPLGYQLGTEPISTDPQIRTVRWFNACPRHRKQRVNRER